MKKYLLFIFLFLIFSIFFSMPGSIWAVAEFKVSANGGGFQIWFEAEAYDERNPDTEQYYKVTGKNNNPKAPAGAFGEAITRTGNAGGMIRWDFDISQAGGKRGVWNFWGRVLNPNNQSDYMLVKGDSGDNKIPDAFPFPGGDAVAPFDNADDRIFEATTATWGWWGKSEGSTKELQDGKNTMYIFHRQGDSTVFWDVFMWSSDPNYIPNDNDYTDAKVAKGKVIAVQPMEKLSTVWGGIKNKE
jgi:hypothetical protein